MNFADVLRDAIKDKNAPAAIRLTADAERIPESIKSKYENTGTRIVVYNKTLLDCVSDMIPAVIIDRENYMKYGMDGFLAMTVAVKYAKQKGLTVICDTRSEGNGTFFDECDGVSKYFYAGCGRYDAFNMFSDYDKGLKEGKGLFVRLSDKVMGFGELLRVVKESSPTYKGTRGLSSLGVRINEPERNLLYKVRKGLPDAYIVCEHSPLDKMVFNDRGTGGLIVVSDSQMYKNIPEGESDLKNVMETVISNISDALEEINEAV